MTLKHYIAGVEQTDTTLRIKGPVPGLTTNADGTYATGSAIILDPQGTLNYIDLQPWITEETACNPALAFFGRIFNVKVTRGPYTTGPGRQWEFEIDDLNGLTHLQPLRGAAAKRPAETRSHRLNWLLNYATGLQGLVFDNGLVFADAAPLEADDLRNRYPDEVLIDLCLTTRIPFVYWDHTAGQPSLFFNLPLAVVRTSTLRISNVAADDQDINNPASTTFPVHPGAEFNSAASETYCGVVLNYGASGNRVYRHNAATHAAFFPANPDLHRVAVIDRPRIGELSTATSRADQYLLAHNGQTDTITCTVKLPASKVNLIEAGMRLSVHLQPFPGMTDDFVWTRVTSRTLPVEKTLDGYYDVPLTLSTRAVTGTGGGGGEPFPFQPNCDLGFVQYALNTGTSPGSLVLPAAPTVGNTEFYQFAGRTTSVGSAPPATGTWTLIGEQDQGVAGAATCGLYYRTVEAGDTATWVTALATADRALMAEFSGSMTFDVKTKRLVSGALDEPTISITPTPGKKALIVVAATCNFPVGSPPGAPGTFDAVSGMTLVYGGSTAQGPPSMGFAYRVVENTIGSYLVGFTGTAQPFENQNIVAAVFTCDASTAEPPEPGAPVPWELVALGDGTTTTFRVNAGAYAAGSLEVRFDGLHIVAGLTETDPAAGTFTTDKAPRGPVGDSPAVRVYARYQGAAGPGLSYTTITALNSASDFLTSVADMSIDVLRVSDVDGPFDWDGVEIDVDRTARPLIILADGEPTFIGNGSTSAGIFFWGLNGPCKWITMDGTAGRFVFDGIGLAQAGVHELRSGQHISLRGMTYRNLTRDHGVGGSAAHKSYGFYGSGAGGRNLDHIWLDDWLFEEPAINRDLSMIQLDSSGLTNGPIQMTNIRGTGYCLPFYGGVATTSLILDTWTLDDCGKSSTPASILINNVAIAGLYRNITATACDPLENNSTAAFVDGGGNSGL